MDRKTKIISGLLSAALVVPMILTAHVFAATQSDSSDNLQEQQNEEKTDKLESSIESLQNKLKKEEAAKAKLEQEFLQIQGSVSNVQREINTASTLVEETRQTIARKEEEIALINSRVELQKKMLTELMQEMYYIKRTSDFGIIFSGKELSEVLGQADHLLEVEDRIMKLIDGIRASKDEVSRDAAELASAKEKHEELLLEKKDERQELIAERIDTQQDINEKEATIGELQEKLAELQSDLSVLTGNSYNATDIRDAVEYASGKTGVPKGVLYGFLKMETNLGANTGQCTYDQVISVSLPRYKKLLKSNKKWQASIDLLYKRRDLFYDLVEDLGYGKKKKVSCSPSGYIGQGGAMGVPQFMSDVWKGYSAKITANTGHQNPDPWNLTDGVMAMAIKLKAAGATSDSPAAIKKASINYLGTFYSNYYNGILYWSKNYKRLFQ